MTKPELIELLSSDDDKFRLQYDEETGELYVNDKKVVTEVAFKMSEKILAWIVAISVFVQALMSVLSYFK